MTHHRASLGGPAGVPDGSTTVGPRPPRRLARHWQVLLVVTAGVFLANLDLFIVNVAFPAIQADFPGSTLSTLTWVLNGYAIVFAALLVPAGRLADLLGRKRIHMAGLGLFLAGSAACAAAVGPASLVAARLVQAVGAALLVPTSLALLIPEFPPQRRAAAIGLWAAGGALAATLGPTIGGLLVSVNWRLVFLVNLPLGALVLVAAARILTEARDPARNQRPDFAGALLLCVGVGALALGIVKGEAWGWAGGRIALAAATAVVALVAFAVRSARHPAPIVERVVFLSPTRRAANLSVFMFSMAFFPLLLASVLFMTRVWGYSAIESGLALAPGPLTVALLSWPAGMQAGRIGARPIALGGVLAFALGCIWWMFRLGAAPEYASALLPGLILTGIGVSFMFPVLAGAAVSALPPERTATGSAVFNMARQIGGVIGVAVVVALLGEGSPDVDRFRTGWVFMGIACLAAGAAAAFIPPAPRAPLAGPGAPESPRRATPSDAAAPVTGEETR